MPVFADGCRRMPTDADGRRRMKHEAFSLQAPERDAPKPVPVRWIAGRAGWEVGIWWFMGVWMLGGWGLNVKSIRLLTSAATGDWVRQRLFMAFVGRGGAPCFARVEVRTGRADCPIVLFYAPRVDGPNGQDGQDGQNEGGSRPPVGKREKRCSWTRWFILNLRLFMVFWHENKNGRPWQAAR
jgi:hypothetical protein